ncbi:hypothetical protein [Flavihumibacter fluvii]|uniref:hypothetical protein n=1 Tax=Flavihumibacter fluvii TaxID=2838157 RepID=UPI001BDDD390|nr:hypothetical protein [Flavihumibacter fluvii]ULQ51385.1 hypothetical protein KJS93_14955 [Flavihumibacter fluvii]
MQTGKVFFSDSLQKYPLIRFLANLLRCFWLFFPSLLFVVLALVCFTQLSQGKDILISFTETSGTFGGILLSKFIFAVAIIFWVYVSWYASRMVAYIKEFRHRESVSELNPGLSTAGYDAIFAMELRFLHRFPRIIGYACILVVLLSLTILLINKKWIIQQPFPILIIAVFILWLADRQMIRLSSYGKQGVLLKIILWLSAFLLPFLLILYSATGLFRKVPYIIVLVVIMLVVYMLYINLRRHRMDVLAKTSSIRAAYEITGSWDTFMYKWMRFYHLPPEEKGYFIAFNCICAIGLAAYSSAIFSLAASTRIGPFPFVLLAFTVLMGFGNIITALSCKYRISLHFFIFVFAALLPTPDHHKVRTESLSARNLPPNIYKDRQDIKEYFNNWVASRPEIDSCSNYPLYIVLANGGASRSAYWVASVLGKLEDASIQKGGLRFSKQLFCLSGTSGGGVGITGFYSMLLHQGDKPATPSFENSARNFLRQDYLTFTLARMLGPDFFNYIPVLNLLVSDEDRADALEEAFENAKDEGSYSVGFDATYFDQCITRKGHRSDLPILFINTTRVKDGNPGIISSIVLAPDLFNRRIDVIDLLQPDKTIRLSTAAILGARFPFISPAGRIDSYKPRVADNEKNPDSLRSHYFVDGGYFDNSGAGVVQEMMRAILQITASAKDSLLKKRFSKLSIVVLHITNSPQGSIPLKPIGPFVNDLLAPLLTITGAFDMQTTVNDRRLMTYIKDLQGRATQFGIKSANYNPIHLYNDPEIAGDTLSNGPFAMNWFISDSVRHQMDRRLQQQPRLLNIIQQGTGPVK